MSGEQMEREMAEQPARLRERIERRPEIGERLRAIAPEPLRGVTGVARGSSDHAAIYGRYLLELATGRAVSLTAPSLHTLYDARVDYRGQLVIAVSPAREAAGHGRATPSPLRRRLKADATRCRWPSRARAPRPRSLTW